MGKAIDHSVLSVAKLLQLEALNIPEYQRPYKWTQDNVSALFQDIHVQEDKSAYRLGSVVFHERTDKNDKHCLDIVDGQQRTLTLLLIVQALIESRLGTLDRKDLVDLLNQLKPFVSSFMLRQRFASDVSHRNLHQNYLEAKRVVSRSEFTEAHIDFLLNRCQVVVFVLKDVSEAFQFFDSQNARGRDLEPHDLLKAFHLREFAEQESDLKATSVSHWEGLDSDELAELFANYLYRIRQWAQGKSARYFGKSEVGLFKGVNLDNIGHFPYVESLRIAHHFVDEYNSQYQRKIDHQRMVFPFHLDQIIINGRRFFEMAEHYHRQVSMIVSDEKKAQKEVKEILLFGEPLSEQASRIISTLNSYKSRTRTGDMYVRTMFDCALIFYLDKFGTQALSAAIEKIFIWAYRCRLRQQVVQLATMDNHVLENNLFTRIKEAIQPSDVLSLPLSTMKESEKKSTKTEAIEKLFREMSYYE
ncbi:TPA: DUF262 domain-containing protein [Vibrio parahaemolyticus]|uniref:DUF262 domain-containing protein n=1 Tax=Vibrio parahaemolyticus TaxID=670 RepID=UPI0007A094BF|nr:DUF262 domain-containing protein [Vibrio parahaemolyticus]EGQ8526940.1 DUF262 domain-containing protein [Vibrio parahaemolyticus]EGQ9164350.1 DUF262 domain-containing protein [Vibrio parahaemolyticus]EGQ9167694.1 DUF262 domain-containing protein [Vibrio parahaemolyticus]EGQ9211138.1 DUF262 domain-containing protein [Vibrio parahaemolyticus]EGQ9212037.1 DUF262 domain-containing protein [Vibrio parahaemolyticus]